MPKRITAKHDPKLQLKKFNTPEELCDFYNNNQDIIDIIQITCSEEVIVDIRLGPKVCTYLFFKNRR